MSDILIHQNAFLVSEVNRLREESREHKRTIYELNNVIRSQTRTINDLTRKTIKMLEEGKTLLNRDAYTFRQAFSLQCSEKYVLLHLEDFLGANPTWDLLTASKLEQFSVWLKNAKNRRTGKLIAPSSAAQYITLLKGVIKWGSMNKKDVSKSLKSDPAAKGRKVWLRPNDLGKLLSERPNNPNELHAWKMFLLSAITGARMSDCEALTVNNLDGNTLRYTPQKTKSKECFVSLSPEAKFEVERLLGIDVSPCPDMNKEIKKVCRKAGFTRKFDIGTPNRPNIVEMCDAIKMHTARHSFATNKFRYSNWTERQIADAIGHTSFNQTFENYVCDRSPASDDEKAEQQSSIFA